ncbi:MAG: glycosyltransferase family 39 protein [Cyanobacteria bacterium REEB67]|nr:glycosyltransferase family 39 protein [Cyanobacteria bacterium REEB67]
MGGDFPLNDDWSYGETTRVFLDSGRLYMPAACAAGFAHIFWGAFFTKIFGFSYIVLRYASVLAGAIGAIFAYFALLELGVTRRKSLYCALLYAGNPIMLNLYLGFMSDVSALTLSAAYFYLLLAGLKRHSVKHLIFALLCLLTAVSVRQSAVVFALAAPAFLFSPPDAARVWSMSRRLGYSAIFLLLPIATFMAVDRWLMLRETTGQSLVDHYSAARIGHSSYLLGFFQAPFDQVLKSIAAIGVVLCYVGLFTAPLLLASTIDFCRALFQKKVTIYWPVTGPALLAALLVCLISAYYEVNVRHAQMPFCENILRITSVGAQGIMGIANPLLTARQKVRLTAASYFLAFLALCQLFTMVGLTVVHVRKALQSSGGKFKLQLLSRFASPSVVVLATSCVATLGFLMVETIVRCTDRYYLIALLPIILALAHFSKLSNLRFSDWVGTALLTLFLGYSIFGGQDYITSNAARWRALTKLEKQDVSASIIDGGAEYNVSRDINVYASHFRGAPPRDSWRWWPIKGEEYIVSFSPVPGYDELWHERYFSLMTMSVHPVYVLKNAHVVPTDSKLNK